MRPQDLGPLKGRLNLDHEASVDANSIYRALHILKPGPDLSGDYTCKVSTFQSEDESTKNMLVFGEFFFTLCHFYHAHYFIYCFSRSFAKFGIRNCERLSHTILLLRGG